MYKQIIRPLLFRYDSEFIHEMVMDRLSRHYQLLIPIQRLFQTADPALKQTLFNKTFPNPVGLAAGFDKWAKGIPAWNYLGFGFAEIGTITGLEQPGNDRPRLFRLPLDEALINRFGFNNSGAEKTAQTLSQWEKEGLLHRIPVGINIGKSKAVELANAKNDYLSSFERLWPYADYFVVNVSSPNTPHLRELQDRSWLTDILTVLSEKNSRLSRIAKIPPKAILVKIAPDLSLSQIDDVLSVIEITAIDGIVATNTTVERQGLRSEKRWTGEAGGLSGKPLRRMSTEIIRHIYRSTQGRIAIVGVGGIFTGDDAYEKIRAGASLVQIYTGFVYEGPRVCKNINGRLIQLLRRDGFRTVSEAVGKS